ncbi:YraN family protein, partial [Kitasatospora sp. NPDC048296]|uniref:YraN family protein n=1 Tax=Kitasatospora sp. NPDC048296 TaxID=3364048 RepID=UPI0037239F74
MQNTVVQDQAVPNAAAAGAGTGKSPDRNTKNGLGRYGEQVAARRLVEAGLRILDRNWRCVEGELDIVALDKEDELHQMQHSSRRQHGSLCWSRAGGRASCWR